MTWYYPHAIVRPDYNGVWDVQNNATHESYGLFGVTHHPDRLQVHFTGNITGWCSYTKAGIVHVTTDDGFADTITAHANLGLGSITVFLRAGGQIINPANIWNYLPQANRDGGDGNLWISAVMKV